LNTVVEACEKIEIRQVHEVILGKVDGTRCGFKIALRQRNSRLWSRSLIGSETPTYIDALIKSWRRERIA